ncbi:MAG: dipeptidase PepE [Elusimicrobiota bacterium]|jgi:dipeptidase E|nr:dipeptidase PepE [Elusimicrobiota bacterium]
MKMLLISNSTNYKEPYMQWSAPLIGDFLKKAKIPAGEIVFLPYAGVKIGGKDLPASYDVYEERVKTALAPLGLQIKAIHHFADPVKAVNEAAVIMVGGGNTFHLVSEIHRNKLIEPVRRKVMEGAPYIGWSAGSNVACPQLCTTNDMPIIMPESFKCFDLIPFQINPHFVDPYPQEINDALRHGGESRQDRIDEFLTVNPQITVAGLREASALLVEDCTITLKGSRDMRVMRYGKPAVEIKPESKFDFAFNVK